MGIETITGCPLFPGESEARQLEMLRDTLGGLGADSEESLMGIAKRDRLFDFIKLHRPALFPQESGGDDTMPRMVSSFVDLLICLMKWDPSARLSAAVR